VPFAHEVATKQLQVPQIGETEDLMTRHAFRPTRRTVNRTLLGVFWLGLAVLAALSPGGKVNATPSYTIVDLGTFGGGESHANAINSLGQMTGLSHCPGVCAHAFLYTGGVLGDLGTIGGGGSRSEGLAVNDAGQVTGSSDSADFPFSLHPFLYSNGSMIDIGGGTTGGGSAINAAGQVAGAFRVPGPHTHAFLYSNGATTDLGTLSGNTESSAFAINGSGQVVGNSYSLNSFGGVTSQHVFLYSNGSMLNLTPLGGVPGLNGSINDAGQVTGLFVTASGTQHAFIYQNGAMTDLGTLDGGVDNRSRSWGLVINAAGQVAGWGGTVASNGNLWAFFYSQGAMTALGTFGGSTSQPYAINASGQVTGSADITGDTDTHAFLYSEGVMTDLNSLIPANSGWTLQVGSAINDNGQITGWGLINGETHAYLLTPTLVVAPPTISKAFEAASIPFFTTTSLTFTLTNPNSTALTGVGFTDPLPAGLTVATTRGSGGSCGGTATTSALSRSIALVNGTIGANQQCSFTVNVTALDVGTWTNRTHSVTSTEGGTGGQATAAITVITLPARNCVGQTNNYLQQQYGGNMSAAASALGYPTVQALLDAVKAKCVR